MQSLEISKKISEILLEPSGDEIRKVIEVCIIFHCIVVSYFKLLSGIIPLLNS